MSFLGQRHGSKGSRLSVLSCYVYFTIPVSLANQMSRKIGFFPKPLILGADLNNHSPGKQTVSILPIHTKVLSFSNIKQKGLAQPNFGMSRNASLKRKKKVGRNVAWHPIERRGGRLKNRLCDLWHNLRNMTKLMLDNSILMSWFVVDIVHTVQETPCYLIHNGSIRNALGHTIDGRL